MGNIRRKKQKKEEARTLEVPPWLASGLLIAVILFFGLIRVRLLNIPLERDEGNTPTPDN